MAERTVSHAWPSDLGIGRGCQPEHGLPHFASCGLPVDHFQRAAGVVVSQAGASGTSQPGPSFGLRYLVMELFGGANDKSSYLAISDGGHFENLAAYELVKRQCRVIIISDAECDPKLQFEGLGTLIRMCKVDFGAVIDINVGSIRPAGDSTWSNNRCAVGKIKYADGSHGTLIYLKASISGSEDTSVLQYKDGHPTFPHESTGNQFYGEDQFESYRTLGCDIAGKTFEQVKGHA